MDADLKTKFLKNLDANLEVPFSRFAGRVKQLHVETLTNVFDLFFPRFRTEHSLSSFVTRGGGRGFFGDVTVAGDSTVFTGRGRERRFSGDATLQRKRYYCLEDAPTNDPANNTLLCELFAYADPRVPIPPQLLDTTVDVAETQRLCQMLDWNIEEPALLHIIPPRDDAWLLSPALGIGPYGGVVRYPLTIVEEVIEHTVDLRRPDTLAWLMNVFVALEVVAHGHFKDETGRQHVFFKGARPETIEQFLPTLLAQTLGGGSTFIQGIGACLRSIGAEALIFPSARADSHSVTRNGTVEESFGYVLVDYRGAPPCEFDPLRYFGALANWTERLARRFTVTSATHDGVEQLDVTGVKRLQQARFAVFHDWTLNTFAHARGDLHAGAKTLGDQVQLAIRRPSEIVGSGSNEVLGSDEEFKMDEGGPITGYLTEWKLGAYSTVAGFLTSVLPAAQSEFWEDRWRWDGASWFLHRLCRLRPWAILKCPVCLGEYFWNIPLGRPIQACLDCKFTQANTDEIESLNRYTEWAEGVVKSQTDVRSDSEIYSAVCERHSDAITGRKPLVQPESFEP